MGNPLAAASRRCLDSRHCFEIRQHEKPLLCVSDADLSLGICCRLMAPCIKHLHTQDDALDNTRTYKQAGKQTVACFLHI